MMSYGILVCMYMAKKQGERGGGGGFDEYVCLKAGQGATSKL